MSTKNTSKGKARARRKAAPRPAARHVLPTRDPLETFTRKVSPTRPQLMRAAGVPLLTAAVLASAPGAAAAGPGGTLNAPTPRTDSPPAQRRSPIHVSSQSFVRAVQATYVVRPGDTISGIAARTGLSVHTLITANKLPANGHIVVGQRLILPGLRSPNPAPSAAAKTPAGLQITVKAGDTLTDIATRYRITVASIISANRLSPHAVLRVGQRLILPGVKPIPVKTTPTLRHTVSAGETLSAIALHFHTTVTVLRRLNHLTSTTIHPGQVLLVPASGTTSASPPKQTTKKAGTQTKPAKQTKQTEQPDSFLGRTYAPAVVAAANRNREALAKRNLPSPAGVKTLVAKTARRHGVEPALALAIAWQESSFRAGVVSPANAIGTMQVLPGTGRWASDLTGRKLDLLDPADNATAGVVVLKALLASADSEDQAIAGYYQGLHSVKVHGPYKDTRKYVSNVQTHRARFAKELK